MVNSQSTREETYGLKLVLLEHREHVDDDPWQRSSKVEGFVDHEGHDTGGQNIIAHPRVPGQPHLLEVVEGDIVLGDLFERSPVRVLRHWRQNGGRVPVALVRLAVHVRVVSERRRTLYSTIKQSSGMKGRLQKAVGRWRCCGSCSGEDRRERRAGGGLNCRLLKRGSALVNAGTTFVCQGTTASERRKHWQVPDQG